MPNDDTRSATGAAGHVCSTAELSDDPTVLDRLLRELASMAEVKVHKISGGWWVSVFPTGCGALWWYASKPSLVAALHECRTKAVEMRLLADNTKLTGEVRSNG